MNEKVKSYLGWTAVVRGKKIAKTATMEAAVHAAADHLLREGPGAVLIRERFHDADGNRQSARSYSISLDEGEVLEPEDEHEEGRKRADAELFESLEYGKPIPLKSEPRNANPRPRVRVTRMDSQGFRRRR